MVADNLIGKIGIQPHTRSNAMSVLLIHDSRCNLSVTHARQTGMLVRNPNKKQLNPATAAVAVINDRCTPKMYQR